MPRVLCHSSCYMFFGGELLQPLELRLPGMECQRPEQWLNPGSCNAHPEMDFYNCIYLLMYLVWKAKRQCQSEVSFTSAPGRKQGMNPVSQFLPRMWETWFSQVSASSSDLLQTLWEWTRRAEHLLANIQFSLKRESIKEKSKHIANHVEVGVWHRVNPCLGGLHPICGCLVESRLLHFRPSFLGCTYRRFDPSSGLRTLVQPVFGTMDISRMNQ